MKKIKVQFILLTLLIATTSFTPRKVKILIIGDSISNGYTPFVQKELANVAEVSDNPGNGKHTKRPRQSRLLDRRRGMGHHSL